MSNLDCPYDFTSRCTMGRCDCKPKKVTIKKIKESWNREELEVIFERARYRVKSTLNGTYFKYYDLDSCINNIPRKMD